MIFFVSRLLINGIALLGGIPLMAQEATPMQQLFQRCGGVFWQDKATLKQSMQPYIQALGLQPHDTVASIGARSTTLEMSLSVFSDSVSFYLENIDSTCLNQQTLQQVLSYYNTLRGDPISNTFKLGIGNEHQTGFKSNTFDKVLIANSLHEFSQVDDMMRDVKRTMKTGGLLFIEEYSPSTLGELHGGCKQPKLSPEDVRNLVEPIGYEWIESINLNVKAQSNERWLMVFRKLKE